jgi:hypothetical protein
VPINKPDNIIIYYNSEANNLVLSSTDKEYDKIYSLIVKGCKKSVLSAMFNNELSKKVKVQEVEQSKIKFSDIIINFCYNKPQVVRLKNKNYLTNGENYWYQNLIFTLRADDDFKYNDVAIILPESSNKYLGAFSYTLKYEVYGSWHKCYNYAITLFE